MQSNGGITCPINRGRDKRIGAPRAQANLTLPSALTRRPLIPDGREAQQALQGELTGDFGRYEVIRLLGHGNMGSVYLAVDRELDRKVALKVPRFTGRCDEETLARFYREARAAARLRHRNLCTVHDVGQIDGIHYLTMTYIEGQPLSKYMAAGRPIDPVQAVRLVRILALAMVEAHAEGIVHRDLKPDNIIVDRRGQPVITDFGLAKWTCQAQDPQLTRAGMIVGTPAYMSPEQVIGDPDTIGTASDVYSLGVILYELLTGRLPLEGSAATLVGKILSEEPSPPSTHVPTLDFRLEEVCLKSMAKQPQDRVAGMDGLSQALGAWLKLAKQPPPGTTADKPRRRTRWVAACMAVLIVIGSITGAGYSEKDRIEPILAAWMPMQLRQESPDESKEVAKRHNTLTVLPKTQADVRKPRLERRTPSVNDSPRVDRPVSKPKATVAPGQSPTPHFQQIVLKSEIPPLGSESAALVLGPSSKQPETPPSHPQTTRAESPEFSGPKHVGRLADEEQDSRGPDMQATSGRAKPSASVPEKAPVSSLELTVMTHVEGKTAAGRWLLESMVAAYRTASSYYDEGQLFILKADGEQVGGLKKLTVRFVRPNKIMVKTVQAGVWCNGRKLLGVATGVRGQILVVEAPQQLTTRSICRDAKLTAGLTWCLDCVPPQLTLLLDDNPMGTLLQNGGVPVRLEDERIGDNLCRRVAIRRPIGDTIFWIDAEKHLLRRVEYPRAKEPRTEGESLVAELTAARFNAQIDETEFCLDENVLQRFRPVASIEDYDSEGSQDMRQTDSR